MAGNTIAGLVVLNITSRAMVDDCQISNNEGGIVVTNNGQVRVSDSNIIGNHVGLFSGSGGSLLTKLPAPGFLTNTVEDNLVDGVFTGTYLAK